MSHEGSDLSYYVLDFENDPDMQAALQNATNMGVLHTIKVPSGMLKCLLELP